MQEHDFVGVESTSHTMILGNDFGQKVEFVVDQCVPLIYLKKEVRVAGLPIHKSDSLGREGRDPVQLVTKILASREQVLAPQLEMKVDCVLGWTGSAFHICQACYVCSWEDMTESLHINVAHGVNKICPQKTFWVKIFNWSDALVMLQAHKRVGFVTMFNMREWR